MDYNFHIKSTKLEDSNISQEMKSLEELSKRNSKLNLDSHLSDLRVITACVIDLEISEFSTNFLKNAEGSELAISGHQHDHNVTNWSRGRQLDRKNGRQVSNLDAKNEAILALSPRFRQVPIESPL
ncbi:hypothetical protein TNCV_3384431 [Trichonephila clavipes]|uniref:Uncharacterized protein n=1 Tax=Trichonephila clavipes TaxID=2585209 RepID=A0A8X6SUE5_TRICX|nr:hypothetical protein TNCV_3384431 [Trichonephila clavipes]